ncbi:MAG: tetratricopeptide repeat protein [Deltaproteobacteria bacterium]|nr:tetratricopeptide repeat protein [Deltaproteobacteria bacterium]
MVFPALIVAYDLLFKKFSYTAIKRYIPFALAVGVFLFIRSRIAGSLAAEHAVTTYGYMLAIASLASQYFEKLIYPFDLKVYFPFQWPGSVTELLTREAFFTLLLAALLLFSLYRFRRRRTVILSAVWAVIFISPAILMVKYIHGECAFAGRYLYLSTAGFAVVCAAWFRGACGDGERPGPRKKVIAAFGFALLAAFAADTVISSKAWRNEFSYWKQAAAEAPQSPMARANYGFALSEKGLYEEAVREYEAVFALIPEGGSEYIKPGGIYLNLGVVYYNTGKPGKAAAAFEKAIPLLENSGVLRNLHARMGRIYLDKGMAEEAIPHLEEAVSGGQPDAGLYNMLGIAYGQGGHMDRAAAAFRQALVVDPNHAGARKNLDIILDGTAGNGAAPR